MDKKEIYQELIDSGYTEIQIEKILTSEITEEEYEELIKEKDESTKIDKSGNLKFSKVNHIKRAVKFQRLSDGYTTEYLNIALQYFNNRCALSGEKFESFKKDNKEKFKANSNLSSDHVIPLCQGGNDIYPNLVPTILQYNISKNGYYLLDWWGKQKNSDGDQILYSPYRQLKLINYMMKSLDARKQNLSLNKYKKLILTPNIIDKFLFRIKEQDEKETDNSKRKLISNVTTATVINENDGKRILKIIPNIEGDIPNNSEQLLEKNDDIMMDIFLYDSIKMIKEDKDLIKHKEYNELMNFIDESYEKVRGIIPFEIKVRDKILKKLEELNIDENKYTVANELFQNINIFKVIKNSEEKIDEYLSNYFEKREKELAEELKLTNEEIKNIIIKIPEILYDRSIDKNIKLYKKHISNEINIKAINKTHMINILEIKE